MVQQISRTEVCGEAENGIETITRVKLDRPDLLMLDLKLPDIHGIEVLRILQRESPRVSTLVVSMDARQDVVRQAITLGARGYILKSDGEEALRLAILRMRSGLTFFSEELHIDIEAVSAKASVGTTDPTLWHPLTPREIEVLRLLAQGYRNKQVATALNISRRTVEAHRNHLMQKLKLSSYSDLIKYALRNKLID